MDTRKIVATGIVVAGLLVSAPSASADASLTVYPARVDMSERSQVALTAQNTGDQTYTIKATSPVPWLLLSRSEAKLKPGQRTAFVVRVLKTDPGGTQSITLVMTTTRAAAGVGAGARGAVSIPLNFDPPVATSVPATPGSSAPWWPWAVAIAMLGSGVMWIVRRRRQRQRPRAFGFG